MKNAGEGELAELAAQRLEIYKRQLELKREVAEIKIKMQQVAVDNGLNLNIVSPIMCW